MCRNMARYVSLSPPIATASGDRELVASILRCGWNARVSVLDSMDALLLMLSFHIKVKVVRRVSLSPQFWTAQVHREPVASS